MLPRRLVGAWPLLALCACAPAEQTPPIVVPTPLDAGPDADRGAEPDAAIDAAPDAAPDPHDVLPPDATLALDAAPDAEADGQLPDAAPDMGPAPIRSATIHIELGPALPGEPLAFELPDGMQALLIQARGAPDGVYGIATVDGPDGPLIGDALSRVALGPEAAVALLPDTGRFGPLPAGRYTVAFTSAGPDERPLDAEVYAVDGPADALDVTLHLPPSLRAPDDPAVLAMAAALEAQLADAFALDARVEPSALPVGSPDTLLIDGLASDFGALVELGRAAGDAAGAGVDLFLVDRIADGADGLTGFSGGLPAPFEMPGSAPSVVVIADALLDDFPDAVADRALHEIGHALGLFHTTGPFGRLDPIGDTPICPAQCDTDGDGVLFARECGARDRGEAPCRGAADNLMFWTLGGARTVTPQQRAVLRRHPLVR